MKKTIILIFIICIFALSLVSQEIAGSIIYAEGLEFSVLHGDDYTTYKLYEDDVYGTRFYPGDVIITEDSTFLEIQLVPSKNILKISENTSFQIQNLGKKGSGSFSLTYGRVRAKVQKLLDNNSFEITGPSIAAGVRGTDFGYDIIADQGNNDTPETSIYCFSGEVEVKEVEYKIYEKMPEKEIEAEKEPIIIKGNEMAVIEDINVDKKEITINKTAVSSEIKNYWQENDFKAEPQKIINKAAEELKQEMILNSKIMITVGTMAEVFGAIVYFGGEDIVEDHEAVGASVMAVGGLLSLASITNFIKAISIE